MYYKLIGTIFRPLNLLVTEGVYRHWTVIGFLFLPLIFLGHSVGSALNTFLLSTLIKYVHLIHMNPSDYLSALNDTLSKLIPLG